MAGRSFDARWAAAVAAELAAQPLAAAPILAEADLAPLPAPVRRYVLASGAVGRPVPQNMRLEMDAVMLRKPGDPGMRATSTQLNWFRSPTRLFLMKARMFGLPVRALHIYRDEQATFQVRAARLVTIVDQSGESISRRGDRHGAQRPVRLRARGRSWTRGWPGSRSTTGRPR